MALGPQLILLDHKLLWVRVKESNEEEQPTDRTIRKLTGKERTLKSKRPKGKILRCKACDRFRHLNNECTSVEKQNESLVVVESDEESQQESRSLVRHDLEDTQKSSTPIFKPIVLIRLRRILCC